MGGGASSKPTAPTMVSAFRSCYAEVILSTANISIKAKRHLAKVELVKYANTFDKDATQFQKQGDAVPVLVDNLSSDFYPGDTVNIDFTKKMMDILSFAGIYNGFEMHLMLCPANAAPERIVIGTKSDDHKKYNIRHDSPQELAEMMKALEPEKIPTVADLMKQQLGIKPDFAKQEPRPRRRSFSDVPDRPSTAQSEIAKAIQPSADRPSTAGPLIEATTAEHDSTKFSTPEKRSTSVDLMMHNQTPDLSKRTLRPRRRSFSDIPSEACCVVSVLSATNKSAATQPGAERPSTADPCLGAALAAHDADKALPLEKMQTSADQVKQDQKPELAKQELQPRRRSVSDISVEAAQPSANRRSAAGPLLSIHQKLHPPDVETAHSPPLSREGDSPMSVGEQSPQSARRRRQKISTRKFSESTDSFGEESPTSDVPSRTSKSCGAARPRRHSWSGVTASTSPLAPIHERKDVQ